MNETSKNNIENLKTIDSDNDGINDYDEIYYYGTNPYNDDTDEDGIKDRKEIAIGSNPLEKDNKSVKDLIFEAKLKTLDENKNKSKTNKSLELY